MFDGINCVLFVFEFRYITLLLFNVDVVTDVFEVLSVNVKVVSIPALVGSFVYGEVCKSEDTEDSGDILFLTVIE